MINSTITWKKQVGDKILSLEKWIGDKFLLLEK